MRHEIAKGHGLGNLCQFPTFFRRPDVPGFIPSIGAVAVSTTFPPSPPPRTVAAAPSLESSSLLMLSNTCRGKQTRKEANKESKSVCR